MKSKILNVSLNRKVENLSSLGINVTERVSIKIEPNKHNKKYLKTKLEKSGHIL